MCKGKQAREKMVLDRKGRCLGMAGTSWGNRTRERQVSGWRGKQR